MIFDPESTGKGYTGMMTPKAYHANHAEIASRWPDMELVATPDIYMNTLGGMTEEDCDNRLYIIPTNHPRTMHSKEAK